MFGIGLPEMIVIFAVALIVVGPDKLPDMAKSLAKGIMEMKKAANQIKANLADEDDTLGEVKKDLEATAADLKRKMLEAETRVIERQSSNGEDSAEKDELIELSPENPRPWEVDAQRAPDKPTDDKEDPADSKDKESS